MAARIVSQIEFSRHAHTYTCAHSVSDSVPLQVWSEFGVYDSELVKPDICCNPGQRPSMGGSRKNRISISCLHETWPRRGRKWTARKFWGCSPPFLRDGPLKIFTLNLNISKTGRKIIAKFSEIAGLSRPSLSFRAEVGGHSNFKASEGQIFQK